MQKTFVFFHVGVDISVPTMLVNSIRWANPGAKIVFCTDRGTPAIPDVDVRVEVSGDSSLMMTYRLAAFAACGVDGPAMYLDTDMLMVRSVDPAALLGDAKKVAFCRRSFNTTAGFNGKFRNLDFSEYDQKPLGEVYPFLACCTVTRDTTVWQTMLEILLGLDSKFQSWYGDQEAMRLYVERSEDDSSKLGVSEVAFFPESVFGCLPEQSAYLANAAILHFKGHRKSAMAAAYAQIRARAVSYMR